MRTIRPADGAYDALRAEVRGSAQARQQHRIHAVLLVAGGLSCRAAARLLGDSPRAVEYWVNRYNRNKIKGLFNSAPVGRPPRLSSSQAAELSAVVASGAPFPGAEGWRGEDVSLFVGRRWGVKFGLRQAQRFLARVKSKELNMRNLK